ncbi:MAG: hypothetical protein M3Q73_03810 [bacterium]|nr:hypothetical protein [bacterium]
MSATETQARHDQETAIFIRLGRIAKEVQEQSGLNATDFAKHHKLGVSTFNHIIEGRNPYLSAAPDQGHRRGWPIAECSPQGKAKWRIFVEKVCAACNIRRNDYLTQLGIAKGQTVLPPVPPEDVPKIQSFVEIALDEKDLKFLAELNTLVGKTVPLIPALRMLKLHKS